MAIIKSIDIVSLKAALIDFVCNRMASASFGLFTE